MHNRHSNADRQFGVFTKMLASNVQIPTGAAAHPSIAPVGLRLGAGGLATSVSAAELEPAGLATDDLAAIVITAWNQYNEVSSVLARGARALRNRMSVGQYAQLLNSMPGFAI